MRDAPRPIMVCVTGPPGAGKSTALRALEDQCPQLARFSVLEYGLRLAAVNDPLGLAMQGALLRQELLPNEVVLQEFLHFMGNLSKGISAVAIESYPRDAQQCEDLLSELRRRGAHVKAFVVVDIPDSAVRARVSGRRLCTECGAPAGELAGARCMQCGGVIAGRHDDEEPHLKRRLADYRKVARDLGAYFQERGLLHLIDGLHSTSHVQAELADLLHIGHDTVPGDPRAMARRNG